MKKTLILLFVAALGVGTMSSCKKTNKGKMSGDWTVVSMSETSTWTSTDTPTSGTTTTDKGGSAMTVAGAVLTFSDTDNAGVTTSNTGVVNTATWSIVKDGTWSQVFDVTLTDVQVWGGVTYTSTTKQTMTNSGTWSFVGKNKSEEFKANDRVVFNTLSELVTTVSTTSDGTTTTSSTTTDNDTYLTGENSAIYYVESSKKKELNLTQAEASTSTSTDANGVQVNTNITDGAFSLTQE